MMTKLSSREVKWAIYVFRAISILLAELRLKPEGSQRVAVEVVKII